MGDRTSLPTAQLGPTGMAITRIGLGSWAIGGGGWENAWGPQDDNESIGAIHRALELGVNWIDTAHVYGFGHAETVIGRALEGVSDRPYVFTKASLVEGRDRREVSCLKRDSILREAEGSLARLGVDAIDLYQVHEPSPEEDLEEAWATFKELKDEGVVRHIGVSNFSIEQMRRIAPIAPIETIQPPYSLVDREFEPDLLPFAKREGIGVIVYSPMGSGLLTGGLTRERIAHLPDDDWRKRYPRFQEPELDRHLATVGRVEELADELGVSPGAVAVAWTLRNPAVAGAIVGFRRPEQVDEVVVAATLELSAAQAAAVTGPHVHGEPGR